MSGSTTEVRQIGGMNHGGLPRDEILYKLEETDPQLVEGVKGYDPMRDPELDYHNYARGEIIDWTPDDTYLESDHARRDPALSRSMLNARYSGGRGPNDYKLPRHPELFIGFTGNDPRGAGNDPRFDKMRAQTVTRGRNLEVRMGTNVGHGGSPGEQTAERPWGGAAMSYDAQEMKRRAKTHMPWFDVMREGRAWGRNVVADSVYGIAQRRSLVASGADGLHGDDGNLSGVFVPEQQQPRFAAGIRGQLSDIGPAHGTIAPRARRNALATPRGLGLHSYGVHDAQLVEGMVAATPGRTNTAPASGADRFQSAPDAAFAEARAVEARRNLAAGMSAAATGRRRAGRALGGDADHAASYEPGAVPGHAQLAHDIGRAARAAVGDQDRAVMAEGGAEGPRNAGLAPGADMSAVRHLSHGTQAGAQLVAENMVRALREGGAAARRRALDAAQHTQGLGARAVGAGERVGRVAGGLLPGAGRLTGATHYALEAPGATSAESGVYAAGAHRLAPGDYVAAAAAGGYEHTARLGLASRENSARAFAFAPVRGGVAAVNSLENNQDADSLRAGFGAWGGGGGGSGARATRASLRADTGGLDEFQTPFGGAIEAGA
jgi:hypothetical protein